MLQKILVADDDLGILESVSLILDYNNYSVITTSDGATINTFIEEKPDLLLLDIWMGAHNGIEICRKLKSESAMKQIPIILMSASIDMSAKAFDAGADDYIAKPFDIHNLLEKIRGAISKYAKGADK